MLALILSILFILIIIYFYDKEKTGGYNVTPILAIGAPYGIIQLLISFKDLLAPVNAYRMSYLVPLVSSVCVLLFYAIGYCIKQKLFKKINSTDISLYRNDLKFQNYYKGVIIFSIIFIIFSFLREINFTFQIIGVSNIIKKVLSGGLSGHLFNLSSILFLYLFMANCKKLVDKKNYSKLWLILPVVWSGLYVLKSVKYSLFFYVCSLLIIAIIVFYEKFTLKKIFLSFSLIAILYFVVYFFRYLSEGNGLDSLRMAFSFDHFAYYLFGSFYAFSEVLVQGLQGKVGIALVLAPIINFVCVFTGHPYVTTISAFVPVKIGTHNSTNVFTLFGSSIYEMGYFNSVIFLIVLSIIIYFIYYTFLKKRETIYIVLNAYLFSILAFSFFNCFYGVSEVWEMFVYLIVIVTIERFFMVKTNVDGLKVAFVSEVSVRGNNAGTKARNDIEQKFKEAKFYKLNTAIESTDKPNLVYYLRTYTQATFLYLKIIALRNTIIFCQYPIVKGAIMNKAVHRLHNSNTLCFVIHDINSIRYHGEQASDLKDEIEILNCAKYVITHNKHMSDLLKNHGLKSKLIELSLFDYLLPKPVKAQRQFSNEIVFAGNLASDKGNFFSKMLQDKELNLKLSLYGPNFNAQYQNENIQYHGSLPPDEVPYNLQGSFGLIWDGDELDSCSGPIGEYTKYNNPHKLSLYVSACLPVIVWEEAAIADFVKKNKIGFTISNIYEINDVIESISEKEYATYTENITKISNKVVKGQFFESAIKKILKNVMKNKEDFK